MRRRINKLGNSLAVTIPAKYVKQYKLKMGDYVTFSTDARGITIQPTQHIDQELLSWAVQYVEENRKELEEVTRKRWSI